MATLRQATTMAPGEFSKHKQEFDTMLDEPMDGQQTTESNDPRKFTDDQAHDDFLATMAAFGGE